jgi:hypothetical protein
MVIANKPTLKARIKITPETDIIKQSVDLSQMVDYFVSNNYEVSPESLLELDVFALYERLSDGSKIKVTQHEIGDDDIYEHDWDFGCPTEEAERHIRFLVPFYKGLGFEVDE